MFFYRKFNLSRMEVFQIRSRDVSCKGLALILDLRRKMRYSDCSARDFFDDEEEFLNQLSPNYLKVIVISNKEIGPNEKEDVDMFFSQLLDGPNAKDWNIEFLVVGDEVLNIANKADGIVDRDIRIYEYARNVAGRYGVEVPNVEINEDTMSYLSQD